MKFNRSLLIPALVSTLALVACQKSDSGSESIALPTLAQPAPVTQMPSIESPILETAPTVSTPLFSSQPETADAEPVAVLLPVIEKKQAEALPVLVEIETGPSETLIPVEEILVETPPELATAVETIVELIAAVENMPVIEDVPDTQPVPATENPAVDEASPTVEVPATAEPASPVQAVQLEGQCSNGKTVTVILSDLRKPAHSEKFKIKCVKTKYAARLAVLKERLPFLKLAIEEE